MLSDPPTWTAATDQPSVLIVEENDELSAALVPWLSASLAPCRILTVQSGDECVDTVSKYRPDVVLLEWHLDGMSGIDATRRIKAEWPDTAVILLSLCDAPAYRSEALQAGASGYVLKSRATHDLLPHLRKVLHANAPREGASVA
jgi:DNA-binding NarL/FixJ family response regulator